MTYLNEGEEGGDILPVVEIDGITYVSVAHKDVYCAYCDYLLVIFSAGFDKTKC